MTYKAPITLGITALQELSQFYVEHYEQLILKPIVNIDGTPNWEELFVRTVRSYNNNENYLKRIDTNFIEQELGVKTIEHLYKAQLLKGVD